MAKYDVIFSCGHEERVDIYGTEEERVNRIAFYKEKGLCSKCFKKAKGYKKKSIKKWTISYMDTDLRFETEEEANRFYENNSCDYMNPPEVYWVEDKKTALLAWYEDGEHPYLDKLSALDWIL